MDAALFLFLAEQSHQEMGETGIVPSVVCWGATPMAGKQQGVLG